MPFASWGLVEHIAHQHSRRPGLDLTAALDIAFDYDSRTTNRAHLEFAKAFLREFVGLLLQKAVVVCYKPESRTIRRSVCTSVELRPCACWVVAHVRRDECAHFSGVFRVKPIHMIIWDICYHGYHGIRPPIRRARIHSRNCKTFEWPAMRKRTCISYTMLQTASTVHTGPGAPTCHVRHVHLTPIIIRSLSVRQHARSSRENSDRM
jgi:hypothetical protein